MLKIAEHDFLIEQLRADAIQINKAFKSSQLNSFNSSFENRKKCAC